MQARPELLMKAGGCQKERQVCLLMTDGPGSWDGLQRLILRRVRPSEKEGLRTNRAFRVTLTMKNTFSERGRGKERQKNVVERTPVRN